MATELEIKLTLTEPAQQQALNWLLSLPQAEKGPHKTLVNRYYDTPDAALNQARAALRVRQAGDRYIQTLKTRGEFVNGAHNRQEWEWELAGPELDLSLLEQTPLHGQVDLSALQLAFETNFQRQEIILKDGDNGIEVAVDAGQILGGGKTMPLHEVEFELKAGDAECLMQQASKLAEQVPVFLNLVSKAEQGYYLAGIYQPEPKTPEEPLSVTGFLHLLSVSWLTGKPVQLSESVLLNIEAVAEQGALSQLWRQASQLLQTGITTAKLIDQLPEFGQLQLALAARS
ncbi:MAG: CYTH domain-containing protein [Alteromonadaceae bacterium]|nr:CYTH domain-containing protein [Alteromonadaceae bacterium]